MALPDDDGTQAAEVALFKRKRRLRLGAYALLAAVGLAVGVVLLAQLFPEVTTMEQDLERVQQCKVDQASVRYDSQGRVDGKTSLSKKCRRVMYSLLRKLGFNPGLCDGIARRIALEMDWDRRNRLLHVLVLYRRSLFPIDGSPTLQELQRQPCLEEPVVQMVKQWAKRPSEHANPEGLIPGVAKYNTIHMRRDRFLVTNTYVLKRTLKILPRPVARRFAALLLTQYRKLSHSSSGEIKEAINKLFSEVFYPLWAELGRPEPK